MSFKFTATQVMGYYSDLENITLRTLNEMNLTQYAKYCTTTFTWESKNSRFNS